MRYLLFIFLAGCTTSCVTPIDVKLKADGEGCVKYLDYELRENIEECGLEAGEVITRKSYKE